MRNLVLAFLFLFFCSTLIAQEFISDSTAYYQDVIKSPKNNDQLISAYKFYKTKKDRSEKIKDTLTLINDLYYLAKIQNNLGVIYESEKSAVEALQLLDHINFDDWSKSTRLSIYNHLGITSRKLFRYKQALKYYNSALEITLAPIEMAKLYGNRGVVYAKIEKPELAIIEYEKALAIMISTNEGRLKARLLDNLGAAKSKLKLSGAIDNLGGDTLAWLTKSVKPWGNIVSIGMAGGVAVNTSTMPFILRGVSLLGVTSSACSQTLRKQVWGKLGDELLPSKLDQVCSAEVSLEQLPEAFSKLLNGKAHGRQLVCL